MCVKCGSNELLEAHHIFSYKYFKILRMHSSNGVALCNTHHRELHKNFGTCCSADDLLQFLQDSNTEVLSKIVESISKLKSVLLKTE